MAASITFEQVNLGTTELAAALKAGGLSVHASITISATFADLIATTLRLDDDLKALKQELSQHKSKRRKKRT